MQMRDYLTDENNRNKSHHETYAEFLRRAVRDDDANVLIVHHLTVKQDGQEPNEIPSADTMMFCHDLMHAVFGDQAKDFMQRLAAVPVNERDEMLRKMLSGDFYCG